MPISVMTIQEVRDFIEEAVGEMDGEDLGNLFQRIFTTKLILDGEDSDIEAVIMSAISKFGPTALADVYNYLPSRPKPIKHFGNDFFVRI